MGVGVNMNMSKNNEQSEKRERTIPWAEKDKKNLITLYPHKTDKELFEILKKQTDNYEE